MEADDELDRIVLELAAYLDTRQPDVRVAYLFGSRVRTTVRPGSDWDIAICRAPGAWSDPWWVPRLVVDLGQVLGTSEVDVVDIQEAPPSLRFRIVQQGRLILARDPVDAVRLRVATVREYLDTRPLREARLRYFKALAASKGRID